MLNRRQLISATTLAAASTTAAVDAQAASTARPLLAPTPPMGWNSWNSFATTLTEAQARETAAIQAAKLLPSGYDVFTIDIQWYEPEAKSYEYNRAPQPAMDGYGRLLPAPNRFPSSANGVGFKALADDIHRLGLKFGVHLMRGIPRAAVEKNLPVLGTKLTARDIADTHSTCPWNPDMYGVDMRRPGAQAYYNSVFALFASWGVDFVKMDDMSRPYDAHAPEIEAAHRAIEASKRPMLLSLSPGETPVHRAEHVRRFAQMWRISDDFWDEWPLLESQFTRLENWNPHRRPGAWPDADMLPLGRLALGERDSRFTRDEQRTVMALWCIARSPLIMGGDLRHLDDWTLALLTHKELLAIHRHSEANQPHFVADNWRVWTARNPKTREYVLAVFNTGKQADSLRLPLHSVGLPQQGKLRDLWDANVAAPGIEAGVVSVAVPSHGVAMLGLRGG
ncbi:glycoside hydrolase family 27 protein [Roseateles paludis]|jgi:hypothetical protein|uniref:Alpha-galactosidase n=1 Tax=Roseateles paludis TaxID=3145238 RepID=A0ABV0G2N2_9BURK